MSTEDPQKWVKQQPSWATMRELWPVLLRNAWEERHSIAMSDIDSVGLQILLDWCAQNEPVFNDRLMRAVVSAHDSTCSDASSQQSFDDAVKAELRKLSPKTSDPRSELMARLASIADDRGLDLLDLLSEAKASSNLLSFLQKNATKGMKYERTAAAFIEARLGGVRVFQLAEGKNRLEIRFDDTGKAHVNAKANTEHSKSADLAAVVQTSCDAATVYLISHKFARIGGGHQDNQKADAGTFLTRAAKNRPDSDPPLTHLRDLAVKWTHNAGLTAQWEPALILDGDYFAQSSGQLAATFDGHTTFVGDTDDFVEFARRAAGSHPLDCGVCTARRESLSTP